MSDEPPQKPKFFISYARRDSRFAESIERALASSGISTWIDRQRLAGGTDWPVGLREAIAASDALVVILSPRALASEAVRREFQYALSLGKRIVPVLYKRISAPPPELAHLNWVDCTREHGVYDLLYTLYDAGLLNLHLSSGTPHPMLMLALALHNATPRDWTVSRVAPSKYMNAYIGYITAAIILGILYFGALAAIASSWHSGTSTALLAQAHLAWLPPTSLIAIIAAAVVAFSTFLVQRITFYRSLTNGKSIGELLVISPEGIVQHNIRSAKTVYCFYAWVERLDRRETWRGSQRIAVKWRRSYARNLHPLTLMISPAYATTKSLGILVMSRFWQFANRQQPETPPIGDTAFTSVRIPNS